MRGPARRLVGHWKDERGSSIIEFAMISVLLIFLLFAVLQVAVIFYARSVVGAAAADGARYGANAGVDPAAGGPRASSLVAKGLGLGMAANIPCTGAVVDAGGGLQAAQVHCAGQMRSIFLPIGALVSVSITGQSLRERP